MIVIHIRNYQPMEMGSYIAWNRSLYEQRNGQKRTKCVAAGCPGDNREPAAGRPGYEDCRPAAQYFGTVLLPYLGIEEELSGVMPTEQVKLVVRHLFEDFNYKVTGRNEMIHLEFESDSLKTEDLRRFREYEATTSRVYRVGVTTYVICSSTVKIIWRNTKNRQFKRNMRGSRIN